MLTSNQILEVAVEYLLHVGLIMSELHLFSWIEQPQLRDYVCFDSLDHLLEEIVG